MSRFKSFLRGFGKAFAKNAEVSVKQAATEEGVDLGKVKDHITTLKTIAQNKPISEPEKMALAELALGQFVSQREFDMFFIKVLDFAEENSVLSKNNNNAIWFIKSISAGIREFYKIK